MACTYVHRDIDACLACAQGMCRWDPSAASSRHILGQHGETIRVWDVEEKKCVQEMEKAHNGYVSSLLCVDDYLISG